LGLNLAITDYAGVVAQTRSWLREIESGEPRVWAVGAANTHFVALSRRDAAFRKLLEGFDVIVPDGMPLVWVLNAQHGAGMHDRVYGPTMMLRVIESVDEVSHFFLGGSPEMLERLEVISRDILTKWRCHLVEFGGEADHVHLLIEAHPAMDLSRLVGNLKTVTARRIRSEYAEHLAQYFWKPIFWNKAYAIISVGGRANLNTLISYIQDQDTPPARPLTDGQP